MKILPLLLAIGRTYHPRPFPTPLEIIKHGCCNCRRGNGRRCADAAADADDWN